MGHAPINAPIGHRVPGPTPAREGVAGEVTRQALYVLRKSQPSVASGKSTKEELTVMAANINDGFSICSYTGSAPVPTRQTHNLCAGHAMR